MRKYLILLVILGLAGPSFGQEAKTAKQKDGAVITFDQKTHDFGNIFQGDKVEHTFHFTNTGNEPLIITNVEVSCGCTTPKGWPRDPIPPGANGEITVSFNSAGKSGIQNKPVKLVTNAINPDGNVITFTTTILDKKPQ
jgi:hypothetical protein